MLFEYLQQTATELHRQRHEDLIQRLHKTIRRSLPTQACRVGNVAQHMGMHLRTLERRLKERGTSFRIERDRVRYEIAGELLSRDNTTNTQTTYLLGYSGDTAFNRSFKRWSGLTPKQRRKVMSSHQQPPNLVYQATNSQSIFFWVLAPNDIDGRANPSKIGRLIVLGFIPADGRPKLFPLLRVLPRSRHNGPHYMQE